MTDEIEEVECPKCGVKCRDFTPEAEFIGWNGHCVRCDMESKSHHIQPTQVGFFTTDDK